jgi:hypothetical protein
MARLEDGDFKVFTLHIEGVNIDNVTLEDIGQYLSDFAELLGRDASPRYHSIKRGSLTIAAKVPSANEIDVKTRGFLLRTGDAPEDAIRARQRISKRLGVHRARKATLLDPSKTKVIEIPIDKVVSQVEVPALARSGSLQGKVIRLGGKHDIVSVEIQDVDGHVYMCRASRDLVKRLVRESILFESTIRVHGAGKWRRGDDGVWYVEDFQIANFETLDGDDLREVVAEIQRIPSAWLDQEDSFDKLDKLRYGEGL